MLALPALPGLRVLVVGPGDHVIHFLGKVCPVRHGCPYQGHSYSRCIGDQGDDLIGTQVRLGTASRPHGSDHLPDVGSTDKSGSASGEPIAEHDERVLVAAERLIDQAVAGTGQRHSGMAGHPRPQTPQNMIVEAD